MKWEILKCIICKEMFKKKNNKWSGFSWGNRRHSKYSRSEEFNLGLASPKGAIASRSNLRALPNYSANGSQMNSSPVPTGEPCSISWVPQSLCHFPQRIMASRGFLLFKSPASHSGNANLDSQTERNLGNCSSQVLWGDWGRWGWNSKFTANNLVH